MSTINHQRRRRSACALVAAFLIAIVGVLPVSANSTPQTIPFTQDWSNTDLITADDNWTAVPGIVGFLGNNLTPTTDIDPQTVLVGGDSVDVIANQTDPSLSQGGVAEFQIGNPVVAFQGTSTADAPNVVITLNTVGRSNIDVSYVLRDIDGTADNAVQPVAIQYRVGATGTYTNLPAGFIADATSGPSLAVLATPVQVRLPATADDKPIVNVRIITTNASGNDEWVGIDDIAVTAPVDDAPVVQSTTPSAGAVDIHPDADLSVTFSEPVNLADGWYDIKCPSGSHVATVTGGPLTYTLDPTTDFANNESCTLTVFRQNVTDQDSDDPPDVPVADYVTTFQTVAAPPDQAPGVQSTSPEIGATDVARDASLSVTFDEPVDVTAGSFGISCTKSFAHAANITGGPLTFTLHPFNDFAYDETCTFTVNSQNVTDQDTDDPPDFMAADYVATFQTVAAPPPVDDAPAVQATSPDDGATDVARGANLTVTFSEPVDVSSGWYDIKCPSGSHAAVVSGGPLTYTLDPNADFAYDESCTFTVSGQYVTDQDTNDPPDSMLADHRATFQTVAAPPNPPTVDAGGPYAVVQGDSVVVSATGSQPDGQTLTYRWDLDDDGTFETLGQSVTFSAAGLPAPSTQTIAVRATAPTGLTATDEATVNVSAIDDDFAFDGFRGLKNLPDVNESNLGTQFIRFSLGGNHGLDIFKNDHPMSASYPCGSTPPSTGNDPTRLQGENGFKYDAGADEYTFKWNIDKSWKGTCRVFVLGLSDGSTHNVAFRFGSAAAATLQKLK